MKDNSAGMRTKARDKILEIIADEGEWALFVQQAAQHGQDLTGNEIRETASNSESYRVALERLYILYSATQICDLCVYNPKKRSGQRMFSPRKVFDCDYGELSATTVGKHQDRTKASLWLDAKRNLCSHYLGI